MQNLSAMHESNALTDLPHKHDAGLLRQDKIIVDYSLKQLPARNPAQTGQKTELIYWGICARRLKTLSFTKHDLWNKILMTNFRNIFQQTSNISYLTSIYIYIYSDVQFVTVCFEEIFSNLFSNVKKSAFLRSMLFLFLILLTIL